MACGVSRGHLATRGSAGEGQPLARKGAVLILDHVLLARFGGIPLTRHKTAIITDRTPDGSPHRRKELITRLLGQQPGRMQVHHVRKLADLNPNGSAPPKWAALMARRRRKTLVVCADCHNHIHTGQPTTLLTA